jgi:predicted O-methyltransferase YrrM
MFTQFGGRKEQLNPKTKIVMEQLDKWVSSCGSGSYIKPDFEPLENYMIPEDSGIQQVRSEIEELVDVLLTRKKRGTVLEIGLGYFGSTHFLWRLLFKQIITIEKSNERVREFGKNMRIFFNKWVLGDRRSFFIIGFSHEPTTVKKVYDIAQEGIDLLFIDGDHKYESVLSDWLLYNPLVRKNGIVVFHDSAQTIKGSCEVPQFIEKLSKGHIDGQSYHFYQIVHSKSGIAYYIKK